MVKTRRGASTFGCLFMTLLGVAAIYFGFKVGQVYWTGYDYEDTMKQSARFAETLTDKQIRDRIVARADSLGLPEEAKDVTVERVGRHISVSADYMVMVELPLHNRSFHFSPHVEYDY
jgi:hypothetical protein